MAGWRQTSRQRQTRKPTLAGRDRHTDRQTQAGEQADTGRQAVRLAGKHIGRLEAI